MKQLVFNFPETTFASSNSTMEQLDHVMSEVYEARADFIFGKDREATMECIDVIHSSETLLRNLIKEHGETKVLKAMELVIKKNDERGYYLPEQATV